MTCHRDEYGHAAGQGPAVGPAEPGAGAGGWGDDAANFAGSYYLMGYAVECAIKSAIAKQTKRFDFPDKQLAVDSYKHDLRSLMQTAGLWVVFEVEIRANPALGDNWAVVKDWSEASRYILSVSEAQARDLHSACTAKTHGLLSWLKKCW